MDVLDISCFFLLGGGKGGVRGAGRGVWGRFSMEKSQAGGVSWVGGGGGGERGRVFAGNFGGGGGLSIFFGAEIPTKVLCTCRISGHFSGKRQNGARGERAPKPKPQKGQAER